MENNLAANSFVRRDAGLDLLRVMAVVAVVWLHASSQRFVEAFPTAEWTVRVCYDALSRWCVPVFLMISGALFLRHDRTISLRHLFGKNVLRIVVAFLVWSYVYSFVKINAGPPSKSFSILMAGPSHFWYLKMILGIYIAVPVFRAIAASRRAEQYFIVLAIVVAHLIPFTLSVMKNLTGQPWVATLQGFYNSLYLNVAAGYGGYFVMGHYLHTYRPSARMRKVYYALGLVALLAMVGGTIACSHHMGKAVNWFINYLTPTVLGLSVAVFVLFTVRPWQVGGRAQWWLTTAARLSFGVYLVHVLYIRTAVAHGITSSWIHPAIGIPLYTLAIVAASFITVWPLSKIPYLNRYLL